ncbi:unnamed protein product, partial [Mesorhabditis belari]|uniref:Beta-galactosidase n=1 Tax=Mesorhabditis belari TaxID=2138241 RepID=A0AAF3F272_9BILA
MRDFLLLFTIFATSYCKPDFVYQHETKTSSQQRSFTVDYVNGVFRMDDKPFTYYSGSIHYFRIHEKRWSQRLRQLRDLGLNAIQYYIPWNFHEVFEGQYNFVGNRNFTEFSRLAWQQHGMYTILRVGPYVCGEWENGGFPAYVTDGNLTLRSSDERYLFYVKKWFDVLLPKIKPMLYNNGGPILMVQIENEFGWTGPECDKKYMKWLRDLALKHLGKDTVLFTTDPLVHVKCGMIHGVLPTIDFGAFKNRSEIQQQVLQLQQLLPGGKGPLVNSEYYTGWIMYWKETENQMRQEIPSEDEVVDGIKSMKLMKMNFNLYMAFGGTNFGYWNGGNKDKPVLTSYDYGAPYAEDGSTRPLANKIEQAIREGDNDYYDKHPEFLKTIRNSRNGDLTFGNLTIDVQQMATMIGLVASNPNKCNGKTFADCKHPYGLMCYEIKDDGLVFEGYVYKYESGITCVENYGRLNSGVNSKWGLINGTAKAAWVIDDPLILSIGRNGGKRFGRSGAGVYRGTFSRTPQQIASNLGTHISFVNWGKGFLFVNGKNMGRYWSLGPQLSLYVDAYFLKSDGENEVIFLELKDVNRGCEGDTCYLITSESAIWTFGPRF